MKTLSFSASALVLAAILFTPPSAAAQVTTGAATCSSVAAAASGDLLAAWKAVPGVFKAGCDANPAAVKLFPGQSTADASRHAHAYCEYNPALRLCIVCDVVSKAAPDISAAFYLCNGFVGPDEKAAFFETDVLGR